jgi:5-methyltetrahydrofolate--homocysteine methyltransferase
MPIEGLTIIGESINDSVPSTKKLFDANDIEGILALAKSQDEKGAAFIDVNVGRRSASFMADMVRNIQRVTAKPLSIDTPDRAQAKAALEAYDLERSGERLPILNSISPLRPEMFGLYEIRKFIPILMVSERVENGVSLPNRTGEETYQTAREMLRIVRRLGRGIANDQLIVDPGIAPIGTDSEGILGRVLETMRLIQGDPEFRGIHLSVGLSNFTVMLPSKRADGTPLKSALESAFLTLAMPVGLDMIIGSMARKYELLPADHPALICLQDCLRFPGFDAILRVKEFYS